MQIENKKLPNNDCKKSHLCVPETALISGMCGSRFNHPIMATPAMLNRKNAKINTGNTATKGFDSAT
jgi:hypothetical protein